MILTTESEGTCDRCQDPEEPEPPFEDVDAHIKRIVIEEVQQKLGRLRR